MKRKSALCMAVVLVLVLFGTFMPKVLACESMNNETLTTPYQYPIQVGSDEWKTRDIFDLYDLSSVPDGLAEQMTTDALLKTVLNYPFIVNIYGYDSIKDGIESVRRSFEPLDELLNRENVLPSIRTYLRECEVLENETNGKLFQSFLAEDLDRYVREYVLPNRYTIDPVTGWYVTWVQTPAGSSVSVYVDLTFADKGTTAAAATAATNQFAVTYNATIVSGAAARYNCHSYAWHSTSTQNQYWMENPSAYMSDGSYAQKTSAAVGYKVTYKIGSYLDHSGIVTQISNGTIYVTSKWGMAGVLKHTLTNNCYYVEDHATNIQYWN